MSLLCILLHVFVFISICFSLPPPHLFVSLYSCIYLAIYLHVSRFFSLHFSIYISMSQPLSNFLTHEYCSLQGR